MERTRRFYVVLHILFSSYLCHAPMQEGVDVYFLAEQMGTSIDMIEQHYKHVNGIKQF